MFKWFEFLCAGLQYVETHGCDLAAKKCPVNKQYVSHVKYKPLYVATLLCHTKWKSRKRQTCLLFFAVACLPTLTFNWKVGLLSDLLLTLSSHTVSPPAWRLFNSPRWSLFPLSCNQWLPPLELLMSPHWLHWDCCQVTEDSCSGWLLLAHHWLCCWEHGSAYSFEFCGFLHGTRADSLTGGLEAIIIILIILVLGILVNYEGFWWFLL